MTTLLYKRISTILRSAMFVTSYIECLHLFWYGKRRPIAVLCMVRIDEYDQWSHGSDCIWLAITGMLLTSKKFFECPTRCIMFRFVNQYCIVTWLQFPLVCYMANLIQFKIRALCAPVWVLLNRWPGHGGKLRRIGIREIGCHCIRRMRRIWELQFTGGGKHPLHTGVTKMT